MLRETLHALADLIISLWGVFFHVCSPFLFFFSQQKVIFLLSYYFASEARSKVDAMDKICFAVRLGSDQFSLGYGDGRIRYVIMDKFKPRFYDRITGFETFLDGSARLFFNIRSLCPNLIHHFGVSDAMTVCLKQKEVRRDLKNISVLDKRALIQ